PRVTHHVGPGDRQPSPEVDLRWLRDGSGWLHGQCHRHDRRSPTRPRGTEYSLLQPDAGDRLRDRQGQHGADLLGPRGNAGAGWTVSQMSRNQNLLGGLQGVQGPADRQISVGAATNTVLLVVHQFTTSLTIGASATRTPGST